MKIYYFSGNAGFLGYKMSTTLLIRKMILLPYLWCKLLTTYKKRRPCVGCGDKTLELERHCKCSDITLGVTTWRYGDLAVPAFSVSNVDFQHDCPMLTDETIETS